MSDGGEVPAVEVATTDRSLLESYRHEKLKLADCLLSLLHIVEVRNDAERSAFLRSLAGRLAEDRFQLAVVGQFSRGKSTLMNGILGASYLPTGALPMTSVVTTVVYGSDPKATIQRRGDSLPIQTSVGELERFIAQESPERRELEVASATVELPAEILRLGFCFVDTPGVGSAITENTATTVDFLPHADAVIFVTSVDSPITEAEFAFLKEVHQQVGRIFVVLNKADLVSSSDERSRIEGFVRSRLGDVGFGETDLFLLSAREGLEAKETGDPRRFADSGLAAFESALVSYLTTARAREFLLSAADRSARIIDQLIAETELGTRADEDAGVRQRLESSLLALFERADRERHRLLGRITSGVDGTLADFSEIVIRKWRTSVDRLLDERIETPARRWLVLGRKRRQASIASREQRAASAVAEWSGPIGSEWLTGVEDMYEPEIRALSKLRSAFETEAVRTFDREAVGRLDTAQEENSEPPHLSWEQVDASMRRREPSNSRAERWSAERWANAVEGEIRREVTQWTEGLDRWSGDGLRVARDRIRTRFLTRGEPALSRELVTLSGEVRSVRARVAGWSVEQTSDVHETVRPPHLPAPENELRGAGCVICRSLTQTLFKFMAHYQFELATRIEQRVTHATSKGFCPVHTWYYAEIGSPIGISASYARIGEEVAHALLGAAQSNEIGEIRSAVNGTHPTRFECPACLCLDETKAELLIALRRELGINHALPAVPPLCVDHAADLIADGLDLVATRSVVVATADRLLRRAEDMRTYALKREAFRRALLDKEETAAYRDVLIRLASDPLLVSPARADSQHSSPFRAVGARKTPTPAPSPH